MPHKTVCLLNPFRAEAVDAPGVRRPEPVPKRQAELIGTMTPLTVCGITTGDQSGSEMSMAIVRRQSDGGHFSVPNHLIAAYPRTVALTKQYGDYQAFHPFFVATDGAPPTLGHVRVLESRAANMVIEVPEDAIEPIVRHPLEEQVAV